MSRYFCLVTTVVCCIVQLYVTMHDELISVITVIQALSKQIA